MSKPKYDINSREEQLKEQVGKCFFSSKKLEWSSGPGNIDFSVKPKQKVKLTTKNESQKEVEYFLWAEAKAGTRHDILESFVQLIITIGKARHQEKYLPPSFLGAFDAEKIAFVPYYTVQHIFSKNDFNWNVTPSDHNSEEFNELYKLIEKTLKEENYQFYFGKDDKELRVFISGILPEGSKTKITITKNNFISIYQKWHTEVAPYIDFNWEKAKIETGIIDADFYLADLLSSGDMTIKPQLQVLLKSDYYKLKQGMNILGELIFSEVRFKEGGKAFYDKFWKFYERPPHKDLWDYMIERRDLLVPQDVRERKGSFFTPKCWVDKSQEYLAKALGENWQEKYYIWDCCAGTGNLLNNLANKYRIFASTVDFGDVQIMKDRAKNGANLLDSNIFQFDFLNDHFTKLPTRLQEIIKNEPDKLVIYINPPYAEATTSTTVVGTGEHKAKVVATDCWTYREYKNDIGKASNELFAHFFIRIYKEIPRCILAEFSKLKILQSRNFTDFRRIFKAKLHNAFLVPANTFDNVSGDFPIGFMVWDTSEKETFQQATADVYDKFEKYVGQKTLYSPQDKPGINKWIKSYNSLVTNPIAGYMGNPAPDYQQNKLLLIKIPIGTGHFNYTPLNSLNLIPSCVYYAVRHCMPSTWLNDRDQFFTPSDASWEEDKEFQGDCLAYTIFHGQNYISVADGVNHWIPFTESEVNSREPFASHFLTDFINGKIPKKPDGVIVIDPRYYFGTEPIKFSEEARKVFDAGMELWKYYHQKNDANPNASFLDIRKYFQGENEKGRMNPRSDDSKYSQLLTELRDSLKILASKIQPKVFDFGFLMK